MVRKGQGTEWSVKQAVIKVLKSYPESYWFMPVPYGYGKSTVDYLVCHYGLFMGIETKAPGKVPTARQRQIMDEIVAAGGVAFVIDDEKTCHILRVFLEQVKQNAASTSQPQAQAGGSTSCGEHFQSLPDSPSDGLWGDTASPPAAPADGDVPSKKARVRRTKSYLDALRLERRNTVHQPKKHFSDADLRAASLRPEWDGDGED
jgi:hypothetical protein